LLFHGHGLAPLVVAAVGTEAVRQHRLFAIGAVLDLDWFEVQVTASLALPGVGGSSLRYSHDWVALLETFGVKCVIVGPPLQAVKIT
jgi:hypothetical protein